MTRRGFREAWPVRRLKGVTYPADVEFRRIVVTGPPGSGKSTLVRVLGGWPEEGLLDLTRPRWWRSRELATRPREVHLALPFVGFSDGVPVHDAAWVKAGGADVELDRIVLPSSPRWWHLDGRDKLTFDVQVPAPEELVRVRTRRARAGTHPVDTDLDPAVVERQVEAYWAVAERLHRGGFHVLVRPEMGGAPFVPDTPGGRRPVSTQPFIERVWRRLAGFHEARTLESLEAMRLAGSKVRIPRRLLPVGLRLGRQRVRIDAEPVLVGPGRERIVLHDPDEADGIHGVVRLEIGERTRLGRGAEDRCITTRLPPDTLPWLEVVNQPDGVLLVDLDSPTGTDLEPEPREEGRRLVERRRSALERLNEILGGANGEDSGGTESPLDLLERVVDRLADAPYRGRDERGLSGGLVSLPDEVVPLVVGDLHTSVDHLLGVLTRNRYLQELEAGRAALVMLGDAVHRDREPDLGDMGSSIATMDLVLALLDRFPRGAIYVLGNHDSFSPEVRKGAVPQGVLWREALLRERGVVYVRALERFYDRSPYVVEARGLLACHAGPPTETCTRRAIIDCWKHPRLRHQLTWNRPRAANNPAGYTRRDVRSFRAALGAPDSALVVSHTAPADRRSWVRDFAGIRDHHLVYSADPERYSVATRWAGELVLVEYPGEPLADAIAFPATEPARRLPRLL